MSNREMYDLLCGMNKNEINILLNTCIIFLEKQHDIPFKDTIDYCKKLHKEMVKWDKQNEQ